MADHDNVQVEYEEEYEYDEGDDEPEEDFLAELGSDRFRATPMHGQDGDLR